MPRNESQENVTYIVTTQGKVAIETLLLKPNHHYSTTILNVGLHWIQEIPKGYQGQGVVALII
jgi:hypothetical protein